jgi:hypothetical protein
MGELRRVLKVVTLRKLVYVERVRFVNETDLLKNCGTTPEAYKKRTRRKPLVASATGEGASATGELRYAVFGSKGQVIQQCKTHFVVVDVGGGEERIFADGKYRFHSDKVIIVD